MGPRSVAAAAEAAVGAATTPASVLRQFVVVVAATASSLGIGKDGKLPWRLKEDMAFFKRVTSETKLPQHRNAVIMGRRTWESIPEKFRPLPGRLNIVLTRQADALRGQLPQEVRVAESLEDALSVACETRAEEPGVEEVFVIGGGAVYEEAMRSPWCKKVLLTEVSPKEGSEEDLGCDTFFPTPHPGFYRKTSASPPASEGAFDYRFTCYERSCAGSAVRSPSIATSNARIAAPASPAPSLATGWTAVPQPSGDCFYFNEESGQVQWHRPLDANPSARSDPTHEEWQYLDLIRDIIDHGVRRGDRTGTGTVSKFGAQMRFSLRDGRFPLLTTKRVFWRGVAEELLWFLRGCTDATQLAAKGVHIWDGNGSRDFLDKRGLGHREEGDLGPVYGFQWRHFGATYRDMHADYTNEGVDQLRQLVADLKANPESRRHVLTAWNPSDLPLMALPPCHMMAQFYVADGELSCLLYQRSADMGLGVPFNIASYALLTYLLAQVTGLRPGELVHCIGDAHVYLNHVEPLREQLRREPLPFPTLSIKAGKTEIDAFEMSDFTLHDYTSHGKIHMDMAV